MFAASAGSCPSSYSTSAPSSPRSQGVRQSASSGEAVAARGEQARGQLLGRLGRVAVPPAGREQPDVARLERPGLEHGGQPSCGAGRGSRTSRRTAPRRRRWRSAPGGSPRRSTLHAVVLEVDVAAHAARSTRVKSSGDSATGKVLPVSKTMRTVGPDSSQKPTSSRLVKSWWFSISEHEPRRLGAPAQVARASAARPAAGVVPLRRRRRRGRRTGSG